MLIQKVLYKVIYKTIQCRIIIGKYVRFLCCYMRGNISRLLRPCSVSTGKYLSSFQRSVVPPSSGLGRLDPRGGGTAFHKCCDSLPGDMA
jgi:hypothetical protein